MKSGHRRISNWQQKFDVTLMWNRGFKADGMGGCNRMDGQRSAADDNRQAGLHSMEIRKIGGCVKVAICWANGSIDRLHHL